MDQRGTVEKMTCASAGGTVAWPCTAAAAGACGERGSARSSHTCCTWARPDTLSSPPAAPPAAHLGVQEGGERAGAERAPHHDAPRQRVVVSGPQVGQRVSRGRHSRRGDAKGAQRHAAQHHRLGCGQLHRRHARRVHAQPHSGQREEKGRGEDGDVAGCGGEGHSRAVLRGRGQARTGSSTGGGAQRPRVHLAPAPAHAGASLTQAERGDIVGVHC